VFCSDTGSNFDTRRYVVYLYWIYKKKKPNRAVSRAGVWLLLLLFLLEILLSKSFSRHYNISSLISVLYNFMLIFMSIVFKSSATPSIHFFLGHLRGRLPWGFHSKTARSGPFSWHTYIHSWRSGQIFRHTLFSNVLNFLSITVVAVQASHPYVKSVLIIITFKLISYIAFWS